MLALIELQKDERELERAIVKMDEGLLPNDILQHAFNLFAAGVDAYRDPKPKGTDRVYWSYMNTVRGDSNMRVARELAQLAVQKDPTIL